jgi:hypothetical protein
MVEMLHRLHVQAILMTITQKKLSQMLLEIFGCGG